MHRFSAGYKARTTKYAPPVTGCSDWYFQRVLRVLSKTPYPTHTSCWQIVRRHFIKALICISLNTKGHFYMHVQHSHCLYCQVLVFLFTFLLFLKIVLCIELAYKCRCQVSQFRVTWSFSRLRHPFTSA